MKKDARWGVEKDWVAVGTTLKHTSLAGPENWMCTRCPCGKRAVYWSSQYYDHEGLCEEHFQEVFHGKESDIFGITDTDRGEVKIMGTEDTQLFKDDRTVAQRIADVGKDDDTKLLERASVIHRDGTLTDYGRNIVLESFFKNNRSDVVSVVRQLEDEAKDKKKAKK